MSLSPSEAPLKGIVLNPIGQKQFIDHLAPASVLFGIPHLFHTQEEIDLAKKYYPGIKCVLLPYEEFSPEWVISQYDFSVLSDQWKRESMHEKYQLLEMKYGKKMRNLHCPHGYSDKAFYLKDIVYEDISMVYGKRMLRMFDEWEVRHRLNPYLIVGNYRFSYYMDHREYLDRLAQEELFSKFAEEQPTLLYAPTCVDQQKTTSFFDAVDDVVKGLPAHYNMVVKLHPRLEDDNPSRFYSLIVKNEGRPNLQIVKDFPLIYPLLSRIAVYIGDMSSVGYDFLVFDRPMFFLNQLKQKFPSYECGTVIEPDEYKNLYAILEKELPEDQKKYQEKRQFALNDTFGPMRSQQSIRQQLREILDGKIPDYGKIDS
ncbi:MAG: CDP-glycerol glycerophosphotransferase family protein [Parachlamydiaceae bacterium]